jgi:hypothetical protein
LLSTKWKENLIELSVDGSVCIIIIIGFLTVNLEEFKKSIGIVVTKFLPFQVGFFFFLVGLGLNSGLHPCKAGALLLDPHPQPLFTSLK